MDTPHRQQRDVPRAARLGAGMALAGAELGRPSTQYRCAKSGCYISPKAVSPTRDGDLTAYCPRCRGWVLVRNTSPARPRRDAERGRMLREACEQAGVELGMKDRDVVDWLAGWDYGTVRVITDLIRRAGAR